MYLKRIGKALFAVLGALLLAAGIPALWFWVGGQLGGDFVPGESLSPQTFAAILPGMLITYVIVLDIASRVYRRTRSEQELRMTGWPARRASWNRSMRDEPGKPGTAKLSAIEVSFVLSAIAASLAFQVWFLFFAGSPF